MSQRKPSKIQQLDELVGALSSGEIDDEGIALLEDLLAEDPEAQERYLDYIEMVCELRHYHGMAARGKFAPDSSPDAGSRDDDESDGPESRPFLFSRRLFGWSAVAAAAGILFVLSFFFVREPTDTAQPIDDSLYSFVLWRLGDNNDSNEEFSQERKEENDPPGSSTAQDDDYYFAGTYKDIGDVPVDEDFKNFDRALIRGDSRNRIHFVLGEGLRSDLEFQLTIDTAANRGNHPFTVEWNGNEIYSATSSDADTVFVSRFSAEGAGVVEGENVVTLECDAVGGWIQFDQVTLEALFSPSDADIDSDGLPDTWENLFSPRDLTALTTDGDYDDDGLSDRDELAARTNPIEKDSDGDGLWDGVESNSKIFVGPHDTGTNPTARDTDVDGLEDGEEVTRVLTNPVLADTDGDGFDDLVELNGGHDPRDPDNHGRRYVSLWRLGENDDGREEFSLEDGRENAAPGSPFALDDDYYFAGVYGGVGVVTEDENLMNFDRALIGSDRRNRIHFVLEEQPAADDHFRLTIDTLWNQGSFAFAVLWNGNNVDARETNGTDQVFVFDFTAAEVGAEIGENVLTIEREGLEGWLQFDALHLEIAEPFPDVDKDGLPDFWEYRFFPDDLTKLSANSDFDGDALADGEEFTVSTNPTLADTDGNGLSDLADLNAGKPVAVLTRVVGAEWESQGMPTELGAGLAPGRIDLKAGLAQIEFYCGATVVLEGPASFDLVSRWHGVFHHGKVRVYVPSRAGGFSVDTSQFKVVDVGTEFGLQSGVNGETEVQVFSGKVEIYDQPGASNPPTDKQELTAGRGVKFDDSGKSYEIGVDAETFVSPAKLEALSSLEVEERYARWLAESQRMSQDPRLLLYYNLEHQVSWERNLRNQAVATDRALDGAIVGCLWVEGRWPNTAALEFKRPSDRISIELPGKHESLTMLAWVRFDSLEGEPCSLLMTDSFQTAGAVHWTVDQEGRLVLGVKGLRDYRSAPVPELKELGRWVLLAVSYDGANRAVTHYFNGSPVEDPDVVDSALELSIGHAEIGNWGSAIPVPVRPLNGRLGELAVFGAALGADEVRQVYEFGKAP